jgi:NAD(P)-dependent dehydrogenase (short-subunit alcohol dehydrogenase family)
MASIASLFSVSGKNVLVTGGSRGIGFMIAKSFARNGANVLITSRDEAACKDASIALGCQYVTSNLSSREGCVELATYASNAFQGRLDILVNNAGASWGESLERESSRHSNWGWDKVLDLNVKGIFYLSRECLPLLERLDRNSSSYDPGRIINIGSVAGLLPQEAPTYAYDVSKSAVHHLTRKLAHELAKKGITVNAIAPGFVPSKMSEGLKNYASFEAIATAIPLGRMGNEDDIAAACIYLSSRASSWVTGTILVVDGGTVGALQIPLSSL